MKLFLVLFLLIGMTTFAQESDFKVLGQIQMRSEIDGRDFSNKTRPLFFSTLRTRLGVEKNISENLYVLIQIQDSRVFGVEGSPSANINNIDLHQAFVRIKNPFELPLTFQAGRFPISYGTERFIGPSNWNLFDRNFTGVRASFDLGIKFDLFALTLNDRQTNITNATSNVYPYPSRPDTSSSLYGLFLSHKLNDANRIDLLTYYDINRKNIIAGENSFERTTVALTHFGDYENLSTIVEGAYQFGIESGKDVSAYTVSASGRYKVGSSFFGAGVDLNSGTETGATEMNTFQVVYGSRNRFYGFMDYFIIMPANTDNAGVNNYYLTYELAPKNSKFSYTAAVNHFTTNQTRNDLSTLGQELDLTIRYNLVKGTTIRWGGSVFVPGDLMETFFKVGNVERNDPSFWTYIMFTTNI